ncbi:hypothetical protein Nepgr_018099 [Nepenthes gracilis]|uniref:Uncharacterized protein n=1 Tax=Nepenthes gracilis TaxID=150966 RepID=A0AAD3XT58_NEPGR|nr:hypothetical protein Nepgr_018099 [Nepenthes gracilis]
MNLDVCGDHSHIRLINEEMGDLDLSGSTLNQNGDTNLETEAVAPLFESLAPRANKTPNQLMTEDAFDVESEPFRK